MTEGPQKTFLTCPECNERMLVEIPEDPAARTERTVSCPKGHAVPYDERALAEPGDPTEEG
jgi:hypothetical protein